jgi:4Fe-4S ferredoxin
MFPSISTAVPHSIDCKHPPGFFEPVIDRNRCEGKGSCVAACPHDVLVMGVLTKADRGQLTLKGRIKGFAHGYQQAFALAPERCRGCGDCVKVCPEKAITLTRW